MKNGQNRWTFLEIFFVFSVIIIVIGNFFILNAVSEKNNTISRNHVRATQLVQKRIQTILNIYEKKTEKLIVIDGHFYNWLELFDKPITFPICANPLDPISNCSDFILSKCPSQTNFVGKDCIIEDKKIQAMDSWKIKDDVAPFSQKIRMSDVQKNAKKITVLIWWTDLLGLHKSAISRTLER